MTKQEIDTRLAELEEEQTWLEEKLQDARLSDDAFDACNDDLVDVREEFTSLWLTRSTL